MEGKEKWVKYFRLLYDDREVSHEKLTEESRSKILKQVGINYAIPDIVMAINGLNAEWNELFVGYLRHTYSAIFIEYVMALHTMAGLTEALLLPAKDQLDQSRKIDNLENMKRVRQILVTLEKELFNNRHGSVGNVITTKSIFTGTIVESNARTRTRERKNPFEAAADDYE